MIFEEIKKSLRDLQKRALIEKTNEKNLSKKEYYTGRIDATEAAIFILTIEKEKHDRITKPNRTQRQLWK